MTGEETTKLLRRTLQTRIYHDEDDGRHPLIPALIAIITDMNLTQHEDSMSLRRLPLMAIITDKSLRRGR